MQSALRERTEKEHASAMENARIRTALDRVSVGTMLGDADGKIIYVNDALQSLFRHQSGEIRKQVRRIRCCPTSWAPHSTCSIRSPRCREAFSPA